MSSEIITYSKIREYQREERTKPTLVKLPENAVELIQIYLNEKKSMLEKNKDDSNLFSQDVYSRIEYELKNAIRCIANIFEVRQKKIVDKAFHTAKNDIKVKDTTNMLYFEKRLFNQLLELHNNYNHNCILNILRNKKPLFAAVCSSEEEEKGLKREKPFLNKAGEKMLVRITSDVPSFIWEDNSKRGPYKIEDTLYVPAKLGALLVKQEKAEVVNR